jgi:aldehyde:ferredoxin oxidoreductase
MSDAVPGYAGKILRVDLTSGTVSAQSLDEATLRAHIGGTGLGARFLYDEVPTDTDWSDPENRLSLATGPLAGTQVPGSGTFSIVTRGAMTNGATATQANGFFGAYMRSAGFDGILVHGKARASVYLHVHDGTAEIKDASSLAGKDTTDTEATLKGQLESPGQRVSVFSIGPAGEHLVRYACLVGDRGHVAAHNGAGAVMGSKNLKAVAISRGKHEIVPSDRTKFNELARLMRDRLLNDPRYGGDVVKWGTLNLFSRAASAGTVLTRNYTTNVYDPTIFAKYTGEYIRGNYSPKLHPCWACPLHHCHELRIPDGPHAGTIVDEPEYEGLTAWGSQIGLSDLDETLLLDDLNDRLGMDHNEASWVVGLIIECYEKGLITRNDTDGLEMTWGNYEAVRAMLEKMARREGVGDMLAEGAMRVARRIGKGAESFAVHTMKSNTPRSHDHRMNWREQFDTSVSNTSTLESGWQTPQPHLADYGASPISDPLSPMEVSTFVARAKPGLPFEDSLGTCTFCTKTVISTLAETVAAATGWDFTTAEALNAGRRTINLLRVFNLKNGIPGDLDRPSPRYGSTPVDGKLQGKGSGPYWDDMLKNYYQIMGWDTASGKPLPETLTALGLGYTIKDIW